jgi:hypothetical protein
MSCVEFGREGERGAEQHGRAGVLLEQVAQVPERLREAGGLRVRFVGQVALGVQEEEERLLRQLRRHHERLDGVAGHVLRVGVFAGNLHDLGALGVDALPAAADVPGDDGRLFGRGEIDGLNGRGRVGRLDGNQRRADAAGGLELAEHGVGLVGHRRFSR